MKPSAFLAAIAASLTEFNDFNVVRNGTQTVRGGTQRYAGCPELAYGLHKSGLCRRQGGKRQCGDCAGDVLPLPQPKAHKKQHGTQRHGSAEMTYDEFLQRHPLAVLWSISERVDAIIALLQSLAKGEGKMAITAQNILDKIQEVKEETDIENAELDEVHKLLEQAQGTGDQALLQQALDKLDAIKAGETDAIARDKPDDTTSGSP